MNFCLTILRYIKRSKKDYKLKFLNELLQPFSHTDTLALTNRVGKVVKLLSLVLSEADSVAFSEAQIVFCMCFCLFSL